jgi:hypothetical protein
MIARIPTVYLLHFAAPLGNPANPRAQAAHYLGWALNLERRLAQHRTGQGAHITRAAVARGIGFEVVATWPGDWQLERRLKALKATPRLCPVCGRHHRGGRLHVEASWLQLELPLVGLADDWPLAPTRQQADWLEYEIQRQWRAARPIVAGELATMDTSMCTIPF